MLAVRSCRSIWILTSANQLPSGITAPKPVYPRLGGCSAGDSSQSHASASPARFLHFLRLQTRAESCHTGLKASNVIYPHLGGGLPWLLRPMESPSKGSAWHMDSPRTYLLGVAGCAKWTRSALGSPLQSIASKNLPGRPSAGLLHTGQWPGGSAPSPYGLDATCTLSATAQLRHFWLPRHAVLHANTSPPMQTRHLFIAYRTFMDPTGHLYLCAPVHSRTDAPNASRGLEAWCRKLINSSGTGCVDHFPGPASGQDSPYSGTSPVLPRAGTDVPRLVSWTMTRSIRGRRQWITQH